MIYSINYDLKGPKADYEPLISILKSFTKWWHYLDSMWLVTSSETAQQVYKRLAGAIKQGDNMIILDVTSSAYYGILPPAAWTWIEDRRREESCTWKS